MKTGFKVVSAADTAKTAVYLYDVIGSDYYGVTAKDFINRVEEIEGEFELHINSPGGDVFDGLAIYNFLLPQNDRFTVHIDGLAASAASFIACAGKRVVIPENAFIMIHDPYCATGGTATDHRKVADLLDKARDNIVGIYTKKTDLDEEKLKSMMSAETWMTGAEAMALGFANELVEGISMAACAGLNLSNFKNVPNVFSTINNANSKRELEKSLRDAGYSNSMAKKLAAGPQRDAELPDAQALINTIKGVFENEDFR